jgi:hypothetical protein
MKLNLLQNLGRVRLKLRGKNKVIGWAMTPDEARAFFKSRGKTVLTFFGYSSSYEDKNAMLETVGNVLSGYSPEAVLVNIGVTRTGVGAAYPLAKSMGFATTGIASTLALRHPGNVSEAVDAICFIEDAQWGGKLPNSNELSPTSQAMAMCSDILVGIGGGEITRDEMLFGRELGKPVYFYAAEANHQNMIRHAAGMGLPEPESFWGAAHDAFGEERSKSSE